MHSELPYIAFLAAILVLVPLPWHWRARNVATLSMIAWLFFVNMIYGIDAVVWHGNVNIVIPVWCDITTKIQIGANMALPAACMCICIHLEQVASLRQARVSMSDKRRRQIIEAVLCFGVPIIWMALHYIVQGHRFDIIEDYGCRPATYVSIPAIFLIWVPPLILATISLAFAAVAFTHFLRRRITFAKQLENSRTGLTTSRYLRLMLMSVILMILTVASTVVTLRYSALSLRPWTGWANVHVNFSAIDLYINLFTPPEVLRYYLVIFMFLPVSSFVFFLFFAFGRDAMTEYGACIAWVRQHVPRRGKSEPHAIGFASLPSARAPIRVSMLKSASTSHSSIYCSSPLTPMKDEEEGLELSLPTLPQHAAVLVTPPRSFARTRPASMAEISSPLPSSVRPIYSPPPSSHRYSSPEEVGRAV